METGREKDGTCNRRKYTSPCQYYLSCMRKTKGKLNNFVASDTLWVQTMTSSLHGTKLITFVLERNRICWGKYHGMVGSYGMWLHFGRCRARISETALLLTAFQWQGPP